MVSTCPVEGCSAPLEATVQLYLEHVSLSDEGHVVDFDIAGHLYEGLDWYGWRLRDVVRAADAETLRVYCRNDHEVESA